MYVFSEAFRVTMNFTDIYYTPALGDRASVEFDVQKQRLTPPIEGIFDDLPGTQSVNIVQFRSVLV